MAAKRVLLLCGDYMEDYEALQVYGVSMDAAAPTRRPATPVAPPSTSHRPSVAVGQGGRSSTSGRSTRSSSKQSLDFEQEPDGKALRQAEPPAGAGA